MILWQCVILTTSAEGRQGLMEEQFKIRCAEGKVKHANMTPKQIQALGDHQNAHNIKSESKQKVIST